jgi:hypothetical protein
MSAEITFTVFYNLRGRTEQREQWVVASFTLNNRLDDREKQRDSMYSRIM